jgi:CMP-N-acetylneuraminic acid synthetase
MSITALISARGGSTRIPRKNLYPLCGHPLVAWSIMQAQACRYVDRVVLTTDDDDIALVGKNYGAEVVRRPVWENGVTVGVAFKHAMEQVGPCDHILSMLPTSPLKKPDDLDNMTRLYFKHGLTTITSAAPLKETCILANATPYEDRYGQDHNEPGDRAAEKYFRARNHIFDKFWNYSRLCGGWSISEYQWLMDTWSSNPRLDVDIDTGKLDTETVRGYYAVEDWQCYELDYPEDIPIVECLMDKMVLQGREAREVYYRD